MILISNLTLSIKDGSTIASTEIYGADKKTYINIGSGNIFKLEWGTPELTNDTVDHYSLIIKRHDIASNIYYDIFNQNIGLVNEFFVDSPLLPIAPAQYQLSVYLVAYGKHGSVTTSNTVSPYISMGGGTYVKVEGDENITYKQPIMKRALGFVNVSQASRALSAAQQILADSEGHILTDINDNELYTSAAKLLNRLGEQFIDAKGRALFAPATKVLESTNGWAVVQKGYAKGSDGVWHANDIKYEVLLDERGEIILDNNNKPIYIL